MFTLAISGGSSGLHKLAEYMKALPKERKGIKSSQLSTEASSRTAATKAEHCSKQSRKVLERNPQDLEK